MAEPRYRGRFAPSPTGPLHFGSFITALAGFLRARAAGGEWHVRVDDLDTPRVVPGAATGILRTLEHYGLTWDGPVVYQASRLSEHRAACTRLIESGHAFYCTCSRRDIGDRAYPGTCRHRRTPPRGRCCVRLRVTAAPIVIEDGLQGESRWDLTTHGGDFVIWRVEDLPAYHLAAVIDDAALGATEIVRGTDLIDSAPRQRYLQRLLGFAEPTYLHLPVAVDAHGQKLSKQQHAPAIDTLPPAFVLSAALAWLGHPPPVELADASHRELLAWAMTAWSLPRVPRVASRVAPAQ
ncbi:MAG: tRNA glutamyl-Q(34) synthetase GluQRS [Gammaproteobacteria bacterium]